MTGESSARDAETAAWEATWPDLVEQLRACLAEHCTAATVTITDVEGAGYRRPGARLVVAEEPGVGTTTLESLSDPLAGLVSAAIEDRSSSTARYDLSTEDAGALGMGLGANGVVDVLTEPVDASLEPALDAIARQEPAVVATVLSVAGETPRHDRAFPQPGDRTTVFADGSTTGQEQLSETGREPLSSRLLEAVSTAIPDESVANLSSSTTVSVTFDGAEVTVFCDVYEPVPTLLVFGSEGDVRPVVRFARETGFHVVVASQQGAEDESERFPRANAVVSVPPAEVGGLVESPEHTYAVLMSHEFRDDRLALESLLETDVPYVGLLGPRKRFDAMCERFADVGRPLSDAERERIAAPVGLDLGGDEPRQIAASIVAEALAVRNGRSGGRLSERDGHVHDR